MQLCIHAQVNEAQLQFGGTAAGSRYTYKPAALRAAPALTSTSVSIPAIGAHRYCQTILCQWRKAVKVYQHINVCGFLVLSQCSSMHIYVCAEHH